MTDQATVTANLRAIEDMAARLEARAIDQGRRVGTNDDRGIVGGDALVNLAPVGSMSVWNRRQEVREEAGDYDTSNEDPDDLWPPVQLLWFWSESVRGELGMLHDDWRPTLVSEAKFLRNREVSDWMWDNELHWDDYAADVAKAKAKLETILVEGERAERGAPCLYEDCRGKRLTRRLEPYRGPGGEKAWRWSKWRCQVNPAHSWDEDGYAQMVWKRHQGTKVEEISDPVDETHVETWCSVDYAARKVDRPVKTIRTWVNRDELATLCLIAGRRLPFVSLEEVRQLADAKPARRRKIAS